MWGVVVLCLTLLGNPNDQLLELHNQERRERNVAELSLDKDLARKAQSHAEWMAETGRLRHQRLSQMMDGWSTLAENIAMGQRDEKEVVDDWMDSRGHRNNILNRRLSHVGFGVAKSKRGRLYWCALFGGGKKD